MMKKLTLGVIKTYQIVFSPILRRLFGEGCRYYPTCSHYSYEAIEKYGLKKGILKGLKRLGTCHPFYQG